MFFYFFLKFYHSQKKCDFMEEFTGPVTEFKEFERRFKFKPRFKYGWFPLKCFKIQAGAKFKPGFGVFWRI